jgi:SagB-type dehydrogenase family enzyme
VTSALSTALVLRGGLTVVRPDVSNRDWIAGPWGPVALPEDGTPEHDVLERLRTSPLPLAELDAMLATAGVTATARWLRWSAKARAAGLLGVRLATPGGEPFAELVPTSPRAPDLSEAVLRVDPALGLRLSRFAVLRRGERGMVLESPTAFVRAELSPDAVRLVAGHAERQDAGEGASNALAAALLASGLLTEVGADGIAEEDREAPLAQWEPVDLALHTRIRTRRDGVRRGASFRFAADRPAPPALRHADGAPQIVLERPDLDALVASDPPLAAVMEFRTSRRELRAPTVAQIGELLFRTLRVRRSFTAGTAPNEYPALDRPHPSAGAMYETTAYLAVGECDGLEPGLYRYDSVAHGLDLVAPGGPAVDALLSDARLGTGIESDPPVLIVIAADFGRLSWKYEGIAYSLLLKNVGVIYQTIQLAATAMGLGSCPIGGGDSELFAAAAGLDPYEESSVGEIIVGT